MMKIRHLLLFLLLLAQTACSTLPQRWVKDVDDMTVVLLGPLYEETEKYNFRYPLLLQSVLNEITSEQKTILAASDDERIARLRNSSWFLENRRVQKLKSQLVSLEQEVVKETKATLSAKKQIRAIRQEIRGILVEKAATLQDAAAYPDLKIVYESNPGFTHKVNRAWHQITRIKEANRGVFDNLAMGKYLQELKLHENLFSLAIRIVPPAPGELEQLRLQGYRFINVDNKLVDANGFDFIIKTTPQTLREDLTRAIVRLITSNDFSTPSLGPMGFVKLENGCFEMMREQTQKECVEDIYMARYPVTVQQWVAIMGGGDEPFLKQQNPLNPVVNVSWDRVQAFLNALNGQSKLNYRLPTEAEWEYACRSHGSSLRYGTGTDEISYRSANYLENAENRAWTGLSPVGSFYPNLIGLYDMSGNSWEWTEDKAPFEGHGSKYVIKGGSFDSGKDSLACHQRSSSRSDMPVLDVGFRLVID